MIRDQYDKRAANGDKWMLKHDSTPLVNLQATMSELDTYHDQVIAFEAVRATDTSRPFNVRQPLQPKSSQMFSPPQQNSTIKRDDAEDVKPLSGFSSQLANENRPAAYPAIPKQRSPSTPSRSSLPVLNSYDPRSRGLKSSSPRQSYGSPGGQYYRGMNDHLAVPAQSPLTSNSTPNNVKCEGESETRNGTGSSIEEPPISKAELEEQSPKTFQLQTLLKDADPQMLESSVEQGVKLLDQLKAPLVAKMDNNPDVEQWIQQIGKTAFASRFYVAK